MRKYFLSIVALVGMLFATSCQESLVEPQVGGPTTFTVQLPDQMGTKAEIGSKENVNQLLVAVYSEATGDNVALTRATATSTSGQFEVQFNLIQDQSYDIVFWAQVANKYVDATANNFELKSIHMKNDYHNNEDGAAFFAYVADFVPTGSAQSVILKRPFAQLNLGTTEESLKPATGEVFLVSSEIKIKGLAQTFNTITGMGENPKTEVVTYSADIPEDWQPLSAAGSTYEYVSMDYLPIVGDAKAVFDIEANITVAPDVDDQSTYKTINHKFTSVPVQENYRTNIVGNLISSTTDFNVVVDAAFAKDENGQLYPDNDYFVVDNVDAAEDAFNNGETHVAINNIGNNQELVLPNNDTELYLQLPDSDGQITIKRDAGNFNISVPDTNPLNTGLTITIVAPSSTVDFTGQANVIYSTTASNTLNLNGAEVGTIIVKKGNVVAENGTIVENLKNESTNNQSISVIVDENSEVNVGVDQNIVVLQGSPSSLEVATAQQLYEAISLIEDGGTISIEADIVGLETVVEIDKNLKISGNGMSISSSASRVIRITKKEVEVEINDLKIISTAERVGTNDIRGISIDSMPVEEVSLTLNNCSVDFTHQSACDWTYAVNIAGGKTDETKHKITISGGFYEGANVINTNGVGHNITVTNAVLTSLYPYSYVESNYGSCIYLIKDGGSKLLVENSKFNGSHAVAINTRTGNSVDEINNEDNTQRAIVMNGDNYYYSLADAVDDIDSEGEITILRDFEIEGTIINEKVITLCLNGKTITGVDKVPGNYSLIDNQGTLKINGPGTITLSLSEEIQKGKDNYSAVIANTPGCSLIISEDAEIKHSGYGEIENTYNVYEPQPVAKVGDTECYSIDEAIAAWTHNTTLTLLADVTLSDVVVLKSTEYHILNLSTFTMTAADKKDAIQITPEGRSSASYALDIKADATNPGGITATGKAVVKTTGKSGVKDRPIIRFYNGVFNASNIISHSGSNGTNCPQFQFHGGVYNGSMSANRAMIQIYGGTFNGRFYISVDSSAYALIAGGKFKYMDNLYGSALNSDKFTIGSAKGVFDRGVYVDDEGYIVVGGPVITEFGDKFAAKATNVSKAGTYLPYSSAAEHGLYYTNAEMAITKHGAANVELK